MKLSEQRLHDKKNNLRKIFRTVQKHGPIERKQIQDLTRLSWGTVSQYTGTLLRADIFQQSLTASKNVGKTPLNLDISDQDYYIIGVDFNFSFIRVMLLDLKGRLLNSRITPVTDGSRIIEMLLASLDDIISQYQGKNILAISISVQGNIDEDRGIAMYLSFEPTWRNLQLKEVVKNRFNIPTYTFHDPDCVLLAEKYFGSSFDDSYKNVIALNMNMGVGMSFMVNSKLYHSTHAHNGELGHINVVEDGALCSCGKKGCLEAYSSRIGIVNRFIDAVNEGRETIVDKNAIFSITYEAIRDAALAGDSLCVSLFKQAGYYLGNAVASVATILEPDAVILYGEFANDHILFETIFTETFRKNVYACNQTAIHYSNLPGTAPVLGAAMYAQEKIIEDFLLSKAMELENIED